MSFTKAALAALLATLAFEGVMAATPENGAKRTIELSIKPILAPKDKVVGYTDEGLPITQFSHTAVQAGKALGEVILRARAKAEKEGRIAPRSIKTWDDLSRETEAYVQKHGPITTKQFILPGTTPEESERIHAIDAGWSVCGETGKACVIPKRGATLIPLKKTVPQSGDFQASRLESKKTEPILEVNQNRERISTSEAKRRQPQTHPVKPTGHPKPMTPPVDDLSVPAEERYRLYFKDERPVSLLESMIGAIIPSAHAETPVFTEEELKALREMNDHITAQAREQTLSSLFGAKEESARDQMMVEEAIKAAQAHREALERAMPSVDGKQALEANLVPVNGQGEVTLIFVSYSLTDDVILDILRRNAGREATTVVMRGVPDGANLATGLKRMQDLARQVTPEPNIILDPTLFTRFGVKAVPTVVRAKRDIETQKSTPGESRLSLIAKVEGLHNDEWLLERIGRGETGDLGQQGPIFAIAERDLIEVIKERVLAIDWEAKKQAAINRFWSNRTFIDLPQAREAQVREIDPSVVLTQDMTDSEGNVIRRKGERVNPLSIMPFRSEVLIFNPTRDEERELIAAHLALAKDEPYRKRIFIATAIEKSRGWDAYQELTEWLDAPLYLLTPEIQTRFHIEETPAVVTADDRVFKVRTLAKEAKHETK